MLTLPPVLFCIQRPQPQAVSSSSARSNQNVAQGEGAAPHSKPPVVHPRSSQYRWMKSEWRANIYLARSRIQVTVVFLSFFYPPPAMTPLLLELMATFVLSQGLGLFAARDIEKQTMVIEYNGTILRNEVALRKEKTYRSQVPPVALRTSFFRCVELIFKEAKLNCSLSDRTEPCSCSVSTASTLLTRAGMAGWQGNNESLFMV